MQAANLSKGWSEADPSHSLYPLGTKAAKTWTQPTFTTMWPYLITATKVANAITPVVIQSILVNS